jgi:hypothetical protein
MTHVRLMIDGTERNRFCGQCLYFKTHNCSWARYGDKRGSNPEFYDAPCPDGILLTFTTGASIILSKDSITITKRINSLPTTQTKKEIQDKFGLDDVENLVADILQRHEKYKASEPEPTQFSAGGTAPIGIGTFEQIEGNRFAYFDITTQKLEIINEFKGIKPYARVPWLLPKEPIEYESYESLWNEVKTCIREHLDVPDEPAYNILTAWVFATWQLEKWQAVPYLFFFGPFEVGKTRALEILSRLSRRGWLGLSLTAANLYRPLEQWHLTLFMDESEIYGDMRDVIGILNGSYRKGQLVARQEQTADGTFDTKFYDCFGFKALAGTRNLALTLASRCITFQMTKAAKGRVRILIDEDKCTELRSKLLMWRFKNGEDGEEGEAFQKAIEDFAQQLESGRLAELFYPLYSVAPNQEVKNEILNYAIEIQKERSEELKLSPEVTVLSAILEAKETGLMKQEGRITMKDICDVINFTLPINEQWSNRTVSSICKRLGFSRTRIHGGQTAIIYNSKVVDRLKKDNRYASCFQQSLNPSQNASPPSPPSPEKQKSWNASLDNR